MAYTGYGAKYALTFSDVYQNTTGQYVATIYKKGYSGSTYDINGDAAPVVIETDRSGESSYRPFIASKASLNLLLRESDLYNAVTNPSGFNINEFITSDQDTFLLEVKKNSNIIWQGYYIYTSDFSISEIFPIYISLQFSDVLSIKSNRFYNFKSTDTDKQLKYFPGDRVSLLDAIVKCSYFSKTTNIVNINFPYSITNTYYNPDGDTSYNMDLSSMYVQNNCFLTAIGQYDNCYNILSQICSQFGLMCYFKDNQIYVTSYDELINSDSRSYKKYTIDLSTSTDDNIVYSLTSTFTETDSPVALNSSSFRNVGRSQSITFNYPVRTTNITNDGSTNGNTPNFNMSGLGIYLPSGSTSFRNTMPGWLYSYNGKEVSFDRLFPIVSYFIIQPFHRFATIKTAPYNWSYGTRIYERNGFDNLQYINTEPKQVKSGDYFAYDFLAYRDARLQNYAAGTTRDNNRINVKIALVLEANQYVGNNTTTVNYFYDATTNTFTTTETYLPIVQTNVGDVEVLSYKIKGSLNITGDGRLSVRIWRPYNAIASSFIEQNALYLRYSNLQSFSGNIASNIPSSQKYSTYYNNFFNSESEFDLDSNLFLLDGKKYIDYPNPTVNSPAKISPLYISGCFGNNIMDENWNPVIGATYNTDNKYQSIDYSNIKSVLTQITEGIHKNIGLTNANIQGQFKSSVYPIGSKLTYTVTAYNEVKYCLLDYRLDLKNSQQDSVLYSCEFIGPGSKTIESTTYIS